MTSGISRVSLIAAAIFTLALLPAGAAHADSDAGIQRMVYFSDADEPNRMAVHSLTMRNYLNRRAQLERNPGPLSERTRLSRKAASMEEVPMAHDPVSLIKPVPAPTPVNGIPERQTIGADKVPLPSLAQERASEADGAPNLEPYPGAHQVPPVKLWAAGRGHSLQSILEDWAEEAGWSVVWQSDRSYILQASAQFTGEFVDAATAILEPFGKATPPVFGQFYAGNKVLLITTANDLSD
jgi:hypothetical protein